MNADTPEERDLMEQERMEQTLQALMNIAAAGLRKEADYLASECGVWGMWQQEIRINHANQ